jgi:TolA-binding protein
MFSFGFRTIGIIAIGCALVASSVATASPPSAANRAQKEQARIAYQRATKHYNLGEYADALAQFKEAYRAYEDPSFLFNIG